MSLLPLYTYRYITYNNTNTVGDHTSALTYSNNTSLCTRAWKWSKQPASPAIAYPRNLISEHHKCFLQFEAFPISSQSSRLPTHFLLLDGLQRRANVWKSATEMVSVYIYVVCAQRRRKSVWKEQWIFTQCLPASRLHRKQARNVSGPMNVPFLLYWFPWCFALRVLRVLCVCVWVWRWLIKYSPLLHINNAVMLLYKKMCLQTVCPY